MCRTIRWILTEEIRSIFWHFFLRVRKVDPLSAKVEDIEAYVEYLHESHKSVSTVTRSVASIRSFFPISDCHGPDR